jgi:hypothetical protein
MGIVGKGRTNVSEGGVASAWGLIVYVWCCTGLRLFLPFNDGYEVTKTHVESTAVI